MDRATPRREHMEEGQIVWTAKGPCPACGKTNARRVKGPGYAALKCRSCHAMTDVIARKLRIGPDGPVPVPPAVPHSLPTLVRRQRAAAARRRVWGSITGLGAVLVLVFVLGVALAPTPAADVESTSAKVSVTLAVEGQPASDVSFSVEVWVNAERVSAVEVSRSSRTDAVEAHPLGSIVRTQATVRLVSMEGALLEEAPLDLSVCLQDAVVRVDVQEDGSLLLATLGAC